MASGQGQPPPTSETPFMLYLVALLNLYESAPSTTPPPVYNGPPSGCYESVMRSIRNIAQRMYAAEEELRNMEGQGTLWRGWAGDEGKTH
ncbi:hypothetical protein OE88DRAFT_1665158 [Heliocybe sulcata]|uniref:Uncharacterized protein n=1 Tax=Heliocybe sulcata TaxID=5364 RepID=A0A5C3MUC9_9AGAM|nr:hypothetical protein OE88DRAFT_1665158 [Heliocybe sulcata]